MLITIPFPEALGRVNNGLFMRAVMFKRHLKVNFCKLLNSHSKVTEFYHNTPFDGRQPWIYFVIKSCSWKSCIMTFDLRKPRSFFIMPELKYDAQKPNKNSHGISYKFGLNITFWVMQFPSYCPPLSVKNPAVTGKKHCILKTRSCE